MLKADEKYPYIPEFDWFILFLVILRLTESSNATPKLVLLWILFPIITGVVTFVYFYSRAILV